MYTEVVTLRIEILLVYLYFCDFRKFFYYIIKKKVAFVLSFGLSWSTCVVLKSIMRNESLIKY